MGHMRHHSIVVSGFDESVDIARAKAILYFGELVSEIIWAKYNSYRSFFIAPDGSKEGWGASNDYDGRRERFISWLKQAEENDVYVRWVVVQFGDDEGDDKLLCSSKETEESISPNEL